MINQPVGVGYGAGPLRMFLYTTENGIDAKGRVSVPASFRTAVAQDPLNGVYVWPSFNGPFLEGCGQPLMDEFAEALDEMDIYDERRMAIERMILGGARALSFDSTGRISIPKDFAEYAGLENKAAFVGLGKRFEIWSPEAIAEQRRRDLDTARENKSALKPPRRPRAGEGA